MKKLYFIYTNTAFENCLYKPVMEAEYGNREDLIVRFATDTSLLFDTLANDVIPTNTVKRILFRCMENAVDAGADVIVVGCTAINVATIEHAKMFDVPVISVDQPVIEAVLASGYKKVAVLGNTPINAMTIQRRLVSEDPSITADTFYVEGAADLYNAGDRDSFNKLLKAKAETITGYDCIVTSHISVENVDFSNVTLPVFKCGEYAIKAINEKLEG